MAEGQRSAAGAMAGLAESIRRATPLDIVELEADGLPEWKIALSGGSWVLAGAAGKLEFGGPAGARMRLSRRGLTYLLVGGNGHASIQAAMEVAWGGETILVAPGDYRDARPFVVNRPVTLHGVSEDGTLIIRSDDITATIHAQRRLETDASFMVTAADVIICGLSFVPAGRRADGPVPECAGRVFEVCAERLNLLACIVRRDASGPAASALHICGGFRERGPGSFIWGSLFQGSVTLDAGDGAVPANVAIIGNSIEAELLPSVWIRCGEDLLARPEADSALPVIEENSLLAAGGEGISLAVQWDAPGGQPAMPHHALDAWFSRTVRANPGIGAAIVDASGHMRVTRMPDFTGAGARIDGLAIYASMQAAIAEARDGDTLYTGVSISRDQLVAQGTCSGQVAASGDTILAGGPAEDVGLPGTTGVHELSGTETLGILDGGAGERMPIRLFDGLGRFRRDCTSVQAAVEAAVDGDRILVPVGRHVGDIYIRRRVAISGVNVGRPAVSPRRGAETTIMGRIVVGRNATEVVVDGLTVAGAVTMERTSAADRQLVVRNCVIDGRDVDTAITMVSGTGSVLANNLVFGGSDEAILIPSGFNGLVVSGNRIQAAPGAVGIALSGGPGADCVEILGNTFLGGDYGVLMEVDGSLGQPADAVLITGNHFGERIAGIVSGAPAVAAIHADGPVPAVLEASLGASLEMNTYHVHAPATDVDVVFESPGNRPARSHAWSGSRHWPGSAAR